MRRLLFASVLLAMGLASISCVGEVDVEEELTPSSTPLVSNTDPSRSLVVTDPEVLARFPFARVLDAIRATALTGTQRLGNETATGMYQRWMRTFGRANNGFKGCDSATIDPNGYGLVCPRSPERKLAGIDPLSPTAAVTFEPVGLFNRFDLAPTSGATCGEHRIVYAMRSNDPNIGGRAFIIFEAILPNPNPSAGIEACLPVAQFWQNLSTIEDVRARASALEGFYFQGLGGGFAPVVTATNYGLARPSGSAAITGRGGQIRTNFFIDNVEWHLREFKLRAVCPTSTTCRVEFDHVPVKANPAEELFAGTHANSASFRTAFGPQVAPLASPTLTGIAMTTGNGFNEHESISQRFRVQYTRFENAEMRTKIRNRLTAIGSPLSVDNILDRATTQTCAGCHMVSNGQPLGGGLVWPQSLGFVHIDEQSNLSPALTDVFLPRRREILEAFINDREIAPSAAFEAATLSGQPEDAPN